MNAITTSPLTFLHAGTKPDRIPKAAITFLAALLVAVIGWFDYITGNFSLAVFYLAPVGFATWYAGRAAGRFIAVVGALAWLAGDLMMSHDYRSPVMPCWNAMMLALMYGIVVQLLSALQRVQAELEERLERRTVSLAEVHHRVKNNLQVVSGLLMLQSEKLTDPADKAVFEECRERIHFMARLHEQLYSRGEFTALDFAGHLKEMAEMLVRANAPLGCAVALEFQADSIAVDLDTAVTLSLIANELVLNALKHGFRGRSAGRLAVELHTGERNQMAVRDDGCGLPSGFDAGKNAGLGTELIVGMTRQIGGEAKIENVPGGGTSATIYFHSPVKSPAAPQRPNQTQSK